MSDLSIRNIKIKKYTITRLPFSAEKENPDEITISVDGGYPKFFSLFYYTSLNSYGG